MSFDPNAIGNRIFTLRTNAKLSQEKLAENLVFPIATSAILKGEAPIAL